MIESQAQNTFNKIADVVVIVVIIALVILGLGVVVAAFMAHWLLGVFAVVFGGAALLAVLNL